MTRTAYSTPHLHIVAERAVAASHDGVTVLFTGRWSWAVVGPDGGTSGVEDRYDVALLLGQSALHEAQLRAEDTTRTRARTPIAA
jgi:hypothetical protein